MKKQEPKIKEIANKRFLCRKSRKRKTARVIDFWDELDNDPKKAIEEGIKQLDEGQFISQEEMKKTYKKWL